jgi:hypothetical protein
MGFSLLQRVFVKLLRPMGDDIVKDLWQNISKSEISMLYLGN